MKKIFLFLGLSFGFISVVFANDDTVKLLNSEIASIFAPFQNPQTAAVLSFDTIETNSEHVVKVALNGLYSKIGSNNTFKIKVDNLSYDYGDGKTPTTVFKGALGLDFTKFLSQEESNAMIPNAIEYLQEVVNFYAEEYGDAVFIKGVVTSTTKDADGNYTGLTALLSTKIDFTKLPVGISPEEIMVSEAVFSITLDLTTGVAVDTFVVSNPEYFGFQAGNMGLKELLDNLLARGEEAKALISSLIVLLDDVATELVEVNESLLSQILNKKINKG